MGESERSEAFGIPRDSPLSSGDAAELEQLRRELRSCASNLRTPSDHMPRRALPAIYINSKPVSTHLLPAIPN